MSKKRHSFFDNKQCNICKKLATTFRLIKNKHYVLCDSKQCDYITRFRAGHFTDTIFKNIRSNNE